MRKWHKVALGIVIGALFLWGANAGYYDYWVPSRDLQALGFDFVKPWTPRTIRRDYGLFGQHETYLFQISEEMERALRPRCMEGPAAQEKTTQGSCLLAAREEDAAPNIEVVLQQEALVLSYNSE